MATTQEQNVDNHMYRVAGSRSSSTEMSLENRFTTLPRGVVSKNAMGARRIPRTRAS